MDDQVGVDWTSDDEAIPVAVTHFNFAALDSLDDIARDRLASGMSLGPLVRAAALSMVGHVARAPGEDAIIARLFAILIDAPDPRFRGAALAHEIGTTALGGESVPATARRFGRSKQALYQEMRRVRTMLGFDLPRTNRRTEEARSRMRVANYRARS